MVQEITQLQYIRSMILVDKKVGKRLKKDKILNILSK